MDIFFSLTVPFNEPSNPRLAGEHISQKPMNKNILISSISVTELQHRDMTLEWA
jgi:hypothetical protein